MSDSTHNLTGLNKTVTPAKAALPKYLLSILSLSSREQIQLVDIWAPLKHINKEQRDSFHWETIIRFW